MFNNINRQSILNKMRAFLVDNTLTIEFPFDYNKFKEFCKMDSVVFAECMTALQHDGFISISHPRNNNAMVMLLPRGDFAAVTHYFIRENRKIAWSIIRDLCSVIVAIATIITLLYSVKENNEIKKNILHTQEEIKTLKLQLPKEQKGQNTNNYLKIYATDTLNVKVSK